MDIRQKALFCCACLCLVICGCEVPRSRPSGPATPTVGKVLDPSIPVIDLEQEGLKVLWKQDVGPISQGRALKEVYLAGNLVLVETQDSSLFHLDALTGVWTASTSLEDPLTVPPAMGEGALYAIVGRRLWVIDPVSGLTTKRIPPWFAITCQPVVMQGGLIFGASSGEVTRFNLDQEQRVWRASADTTIMTPPIVEGDNVYAVGVMGSVLAVSDKEGRMFWKWHPPKPSRLISGLALRDGKVYVGDQLGYLYCLTAQDGEVLWKYPTGAPILVNPMPIDGKLVVFTHGGETLCLGLRDEGPTLLWQHPDAERPIALGRSGLLYVLTRDQSVACISLDTGKENWRVPLGKGCLITSDSTQPTFYVYRRGGGVMAITELQ